MFKIQNIKIKGIEPFRNPTSFWFSPYFTLIRGGNGAGKTTILESLALLGHCNLMDKKEIDNDKDFDETINCYILYNIIIGKCFFEATKELKDLHDKWTILLDSIKYKELTVQIYHKENRILHDLKNDLKDEKLLNGKWVITGKKENVSFLCDLIDFSRPNLMQSEEKLRSEKVHEIAKRLVQTTKPATIPSDVELDNKRIEKAVQEMETVIEQVKPAFSEPQRSQLLGNNKLLPPIVCYFNTDMYHYGLGLDIRESPKHLSEELSRLVKDRLRIVNKVNGELYNFNSLQEFWSSIYKSDEGEELNSIKFKEPEMDIAEIRIKDSDKQERKFLSSGENQTLSLGIVFGALKPNHSIIMLDEPELHLSLPAALNMYNEIYRKCFCDNIQVITVSHLPFVFPYFLHDEELTKNAATFYDMYDEGQEFIKSIDKYSPTKIDYHAHKYLSLYFIQKTVDENNQSTVNVKRQGKASIQAAKYQNKEINSIISQAATSPPSIRDVTHSIVDIMFSLFGTKLK